MDTSTIVLDEPLTIKFLFPECPICGSFECRENSTDELQCDNCGHSETI